MKISPHKFQVRCTQHLLDNLDAALFLDMGLGKTVITLTAISNLLRRKQIKACLIFAPLRVVYNVWPAEIEKWNHLRHLRYGILHGDNKNAELLIKRDVYITNYESLKWLYTKLRRVPRSDMPFDMIVFDESTAVKSHTSARFKMLYHMVKAFQRHLILTGTPAPNSLLDVWAQYFMLDRGERLGTSWYGFRNQYFFQSDYHGYKWEPQEWASKEISNKVQDVTIRLKAEDYLDMPERFYNNIVCTFSKEARIQYRDLEDDFLIRIEEETVTAANAAVLSMKLRQYVSGALYSEDGVVISTHREKLNALAEVIESDNSEPILVGINFRFEYDMIKEKYPNVPVIYGGVNPRTSSALIKNWNQQRIPILVVHPLSIAHGINLQAGGRKIVWYSLPWSYEQYTQLNARVYRQGQTKPVMIGHILMDKTVDLRVLQVLQRKQSEETSFTSLLIDNIKEDAWAIKSKVT